MNLSNNPALQALAARMPKNIHKRKRAAKSNLPVGAARYVPTSRGYMAVLEERADKTAKAAARRSSSRPRRRGSERSAFFVFLMKS